MSRPHHLGIVVIFAFQPGHQLTPPPDQLFLAHIMNGSHQHIESIAFLQIPFFIVNLQGYFPSLSPQGDCEGGTLARSALHGDLPAVLLDDVLYDGQP